MTKLRVSSDSSYDRDIRSPGIARWWKRLVGANQFRPIDPPSPIRLDRATMNDADRWVVYSSQLPDFEKLGDRRGFTTPTHPW